MNTNGLAIGIDVGGSMIKGALVDGAGQIVKSSQGNTDADKPLDVTISNLIEIIRPLMQENVHGIGIGLPGEVDRLRGEFVKAPNIAKINGTPIVDLVREQFKVPVMLENDANCIALAEAKLGGGRKHKTVVGIIIGTGFGAGIVHNEKIFTGGMGVAGEIGRIPAGEGGHLELEDYVSSRALTRYYKNLSGLECSPEEIVYHQNQGDRFAQEAIRIMAQHLSNGLKTIIYMINPNVIVMVAINFFYMI